LNLSELAISGVTVQPVCPSLAFNIVGSALKAASDDSDPVMVTVEHFM